MAANAIAKAKINTKGANRNSGIGWLSTMNPVCTYL